MTQLPEEYQQVEYIQPKRSKRFCLGGYSSPDEAEARILELQTEYPSIEYDIFTQTEQRILECAIVIPEEAIAFLSDSEKEALTPMPRVIHFEEYSPTVYRFLSKRYVNQFFETGLLRIATFSSCQKLESETRRDENEGRGVLVGEESTYRCEIDSGVGVDPLLLCTSLSNRNELPDGTSHDAAIKITNLNGFINEVTNALIKDGYIVETVLKGPCIYNNRVIERKLDDGTISSLIEEMENGSFDFNRLFTLQSEINSNDLYFSKPIEKSVETEYRILWILDKTPSSDHVIIEIPNAIQYCQSVVFC